MNELEPLCNFEQSSMLKELDMNEPTLHYYSLSDNKEWLECLEDKPGVSNDRNGIIDRPTISLAKNWLYAKYGVWIYAHYEIDLFRAYAGKEYGYLFFYCITSNNPHQAESACLTEVLKKLTNEKSNS